MVLSGVLGKLFVLLINVVMEVSEKGVLPLKQNLILSSPESFFY